MKKFIAILIIIISALFLSSSAKADSNNQYEKINGVKIYHNGSPDICILYYSGAGDSNGERIPSIIEPYELNNAVIILPTSFQMIHEQQAVLLASETNLPTYVIGYSGGIRHAYLSAYDLINSDGFDQELIIINIDGYYPWSSQRELKQEQSDELIEYGVSQIIFRGQTKGYSYYESEGMPTTYYKYIGDHATIRQYATDTLFKDRIPNT